MYQTWPRAPTSYPYGDHVRIMLFFNFKSFQLTHYYQRFSSGYIRSALADSVDYSANKSGTRVHIFSKVLFFFQNLDVKEQQRIGAHLPTCLMSFL